ncbi:TPA: peptidoglycan-binding protein [Clostridioides difficile]|uniref:peptidoglycan-binding domain-containing protein n=1 Tax=Clostridioides difficile TaxID=1496 RepID=UPI0009800AC4|nr:peptidoglycan-binding domain-containing protein [Clostridioides difficile]SJR20430.1 spore cortex-lytic enzyme [Clostridioides difficile]HBF0728349.1 peptidoglycan-binding protein [Clostridioides difficile]HBG5502359.1 peptidoglycan-binding protein [Clostridioides difficile]
MKKLTKTLVITSCLAFAFSGTVFANINNENPNYVNSLNEKSITKSFTVSGYEFTYQNAPGEVKKDYEESCKEFNIKPSPDHKIFVQEELMSNYDLDQYKEARDLFDVQYKDGVFRVVGSGKNYSVNINNTIVGYNNTTSGNAVHLVQVLCNNLAGTTLKYDSQFGDATYNAVKKLQGKLGLPQDGIVGKRTWEAAARRLP